jgi:protease I
MKKVVIIIIAILAVSLIAAVCILLWKHQKEAPMRKILQKQATESRPTDIEPKAKVAVIIAFEDFRDEEYFKTVDAFAKYEIEKVSVSTEMGEARGADGEDVNIDLTVDELKVEDYDAVVFIGGPGAIDYLDNEKSYNIARETIKKKKILAAICISPTILAKAGVLKGKKATVWSSSADKQPIKILEQNGAIFVDKKVVQDGRIITANGPQAAETFGEKIAENLK